MSVNFIVETHHRTLRAIYDTQTRSYQKLLHLSWKKKIHTQNLQILLVEVINAQLLKLSKCRTKTHGLNKALFKEALLCNKLPNHFKEAKYISKTKFGNGRGGHVLVGRALKLSTFKKYTYIKKCPS